MERKIGLQIYPTGASNWSTTKYERYQVTYISVLKLFLQQVPCNSLQSCPNHENIPDFDHINHFLSTIIEIFITVETELLSNPPARELDPHCSCKARTLPRDFMFALSAMWEMDICKLWIWDKKRRFDEGFLQSIFGQLLVGENRQTKSKN